MDFINICKQNLKITQQISMFDRIFRLFIILLPWSVLASVFLGTRLGIPGVSYFKEIFLIALAGIIAYEYFKKKE